ncbi:MAG: 5'-nucleotidase [Limnobacter sp.]|uniref:5'-nucleotidase n=1 Tax=Limnobacter sp. TaxID=2003368 RepID=UPI00391A1CA2
MDSGKLVNSSEVSGDGPSTPYLTIAIASSALFDLTESDSVFRTQGEEAYAKYQRNHESVPLNPGPAFGLVSKLLALNKGRASPLVEVVLVSKNSVDTGLRIFHSIRHHHLGITRASFSRGRSPFVYAQAFGANLFLSSSESDVREAIASGIPAARLIGSSAQNTLEKTEIRLAFDGDAVIFSDEAEQIFAASGLLAFEQSEVESKDQPMAEGPLHGLLAAIHQLQSVFPSGACPLRTALVTARAAPTHERVINTLRSWGIRIDEAVFLGGRPKGPFLRAFGADIFFDDQMHHLESTRQHVSSAHVPYGVKNLPLERKPDCK